ncbi:MAG: HAMP domain-containing histidine kinase [Lachnospiraceae bacterium]|jgi:signal transduction histidine kinase|nr:HAMP domain-containing histidine kinase [Lachnospiraceae bacterium]
MGFAFALAAGMAAVLCVLAGILALRLLCYRRQVRHILEQMEFLEALDSNFLLTAANRAGRTEEMISRMNQATEGLRDQVRRLQKTNQSYRESITSISHDIRTPLTSVKGYVQMLQQPGMPEGKKREYLDIIERRLEDLSQMLKQLFEYARLEAGEMEWNLERLNASNLFAEIISMFYEDFLEKGCEPEVEVFGKPCYIWADSHAFARIVENLMKNALVHGLGGYRFALAPVGEEVSICISNETDSIEEKELERVFDRFYTTDQSRSRRSTGLGLAIAQEFTGQMGGKIGASLQEGRFSIEVRFPRIG